MSGEVRIAESVEQVSMIPKMCATCKWYSGSELYPGGPIEMCMNERSDRMNDWLEQDETCDEWEGKI